MMSRPRVVQRAPASAKQLERFVAAPAGWCNNNLWVLLRLRGTLDLDRLEAALANLVERHEALRTTLHASDGGLEQLIWDEMPYTIQKVDLSACDSPMVELEQRLPALLNERVQLSDSELCAVWLFNLGVNDHALFIRIHHTMSDGRSLGLIRSELPELYAARASGGSHDLEPLTVQFRDYVALQQTSATPAARQFWKDHLPLRPSYSAQVVERPSNVPHPILDHALAPVEATTVEQLTKITSELRCSRTVGMMAVVASSFVASGDEDLILGVVFSNRHRPEYADVFGGIADVLPVRIGLGGEPTFRDMIGRARRAWFLALGRQLSLDQIIDAVGFDRVESPVPLFDVLFNYHPFREDRAGTRVIEDVDGCVLEIEPLNLELEGLYSSAARRTMISSWDFDAAERADGSLCVRLMFQEGTASPDAIAQLEARLLGTLARVIAHPDRSLVELRAAAPTA